MTESPFDIRLMTDNDIALGMRLKTQAGWNQTDADWQRFLALQPNGCFVAEFNGRPVGTVTTCVLGSVGWIGMMLVDSAHRRRGIGTALMQRALQSLETEGVATVRLDATPMGRLVYQRLGFQDQYQLIRYAGSHQPASMEAHVDRLEGSDLDRLVEFDASAVGTDRGRLLRRLAAEESNAARVFQRQGEIEGYLLGRSGTTARQIGPCIARSQTAGRALMAHALSQFAGQKVYVDVPVSNSPAVSVVESSGLLPQRELTRMCRGKQNQERIEWLWASSGPEKG